MPDTPTLILAGGGMSSLVAIAAIRSETRPQQVSLLHLRDYRTNAAPRLEHVRRQAEHYAIGQLIELPSPQQRLRRDAGPANESYLAPLHQPQLLMVGLSVALATQVDRLIWPIAVNADFDAAARITEQVILTQTIAQIEHPSLPDIETPLLELTDRQLIELGGQLEAPWQLAWTCLLHGEKPCRVCAGCRRRIDTFDTAGMIDPITKDAIAAR